MPRYRNVIIPRIMEHWIAFRVLGHVNAALPGTEGRKIGRWIEMIVKIDDPHQPLPW
jgi:hypothetical protein